MPESVAQNGVSFTPEKVVNLDELINKGKPEAEGAGEKTDSTPEQTQTDTATEQVSKSESIESKTEDSTESNQEIKGDDKGQTIKDGDDIPLDEIHLNIGDREMNASELVDEYEKLNSEIKKIKDDQFLGKFIEFYQNGGDPAEFFQKATVKWDKVSDIDIMRMKFNEENSDLEDEVKNIIFERELLEKYSINPDGTFEDESSREAKVGRQILKRDATKIRESKIEEQKSFLLPQKKEESQQPTYDPQKAREELMNDQELKDFVSKKSLPVSEGLSYEVSDPAKVIGMMADINEFWKLFQKPDGSWDKNAVAKVFAFALDPKKYDDHILKLGQDVGSESYIKEQKNTVERGKTRVIDKSTDRDDVKIVGGKIVGNNRDEILNAFVAQKRK